MQRKKPRSTRASAPPPAQPASARHWTRRIATPVAVFACLYCVAAFFLHRAFFPVADTDVETDFFLDMAVAAQHLLDGKFSVADYPYKGPLYSFLLLPIRLVVGNWYAAAVILNIIAGGVCLILAECLVRRLWGRMLAIAVVVFLAVQRDIVTLMHRANTDVVFLALVLAAAVAMLTPVRTRKHLVVAGALSAAAFLVRYNGIFLPLAAVPMLLLLPVGASLHERLRRVVFYAIGFAAIASPWFAKNLQETGSVLKTRNVDNVAVAVYGMGYPRKFDGFLDVVTHDPGRFAAAFARSLFAQLHGDSLELLGWPMAILVGVGILVLVVRHQRRVFQVIAAMVFVIIVGHQAKRALAEERRIYARRPLFVLPVSDFLQRDAATSGRRVVAARKALVAYYSGLQHVGFPAQLGSIDELLAFVKQRHVDYVVFSTIELGLMPDIRGLAVMRDIPGFKEVYRIREARVLVPDPDFIGAMSADQKRAVLEQNLQFARKAEEPLQVAKNALALAFLDANSRGPREAATGLEPILTELQQGEDSAVARESIAKVQVALGYFLAAAGEPEKAFEFIPRAIALFEAAGKDVDRAQAYMALGEVYEMQRQAAAAAEQYRIAIDILEKAGDTNGVAKARRSLADVEGASKP